MTSHELRLIEPPPFDVAADVDWVLVTHELAEQTHVEGEWAKEGEEERGTLRRTKIIDRPSRPVLPGRPGRAYRLAAQRWGPARDPRIDRAYRLLLRVVVGSLRL